MKKKILFVMSRMSIGGSQKSLVNALKIIDYSKYDVTLYVRENKTDLIADVPKAVRVVVNTNKASYEYYPVPLLYEILTRLFRVIKYNRGEIAINRKSVGYIANKKTRYEKKHYSILSESYDYAISYLQGYTCKFTADCAESDKRICFFHNSTDSLPELHEECLPRYDKIVVVAKETQRFLRERYPSVSDRIVVIQNIMDISGIKQKSEEREIERMGRKTILCTCGRISKEKGYDLAVESARILNLKGVSFLWYFVGDGPEFDSIKNKAEEYGISNCVVFTGIQSNPYPWIGGCDIYVQPSYEEAQGLTILEAQVLRKPVVSTDTVGARSIIDNHSDGLLAEINPEDLADKINYLINNEAEKNLYIHNLQGNKYDRYNDGIIKEWHKLLEGEK